MQTKTLSRPESLILVIFGGSGDLTKRKLIPSLYQLFKLGRMPQRFAILGLGRTHYEDDSYRVHLIESMKMFLDDKEYNQELAEKFLSNVHYHTMDPSNGENYPELKNILEDIDKKIDNPHNYIYYLSTPPKLYGIVPLHLQSVGLNLEGDESGGSYIRRIVIEKPFGYDLNSAIELNKVYKSVFAEHQIYRIDHFLGKEPVQNIMALRFANSIFEPIWNRNYIDRVEVTAVENMGIESRGGFYDSTGALRDMVQNHLSQLVAITAMEAPVHFQADLFRDEVLKVYQSFKPMTKKEIATNVIRAQYTSSNIDGNQEKGYTQEDKVSPESKTETFVAMKLFIDNWRWAGVPFYLRTGKRLPAKVSEIVVHFKPTPHQMFASLGAGVPNKLIIRVSPNEGISLKFAAKVPGSGFEIKQTSMDFTYNQFEGLTFLDAYSRLLEDCMIGDSTLFTRSDALEESWRFFDPILKAWEEEALPLYYYPAGSWGPVESNSIMERENHEWTNPIAEIL